VRTAVGLDDASARHEIRFFTSDECDRLWNEMNDPGARRLFVDFPSASVLELVHGSAVRLVVLPTTWSWEQVKSRLKAVAWIPEERDVDITDSNDSTIIYHGTSGAVFRDVYRVGLKLRPYVDMRLFTGEPPPITPAQPEAPRPPAIIPPAPPAPSVSSASSTPSAVSSSRVI
jgi:hypothetical protein